MSASGRMPNYKNSKTNRMSVYIKEGAISSAFLRIIDQHYMELMPNYRCCVKEYEREKTKATVERKMSLFPERADWKPSGRELSSDEKMLFKGPPNLVMFQRRVTIVDHTGRSVDYTAAQYEKSTKFCCSYVAIKEPSSTVPRFGRIAVLFEHSFAGIRSQWAILDEYLHSTQDGDSKLWRTIPQNVNQTLIFLA